ncbi:hypothetical protein PviCFBP13515_05345 [Pseudomonas viridiflava]|jgi:hypothetical protein|nr:hypothetical protein PviCFBP13507_16655 [Pseudomonas viridiflava]TKK31298.1 hypothetical protein PviCFBP13515_05345 [Pseudomonas viridiflava]
MMSNRQQMANSLAAVGRTRNNERKKSQTATEGGALRLAGQPGLSRSIGIQPTQRSKRYSKQIDQTIIY